MNEAMRQLSVKSAAVASLVLLTILAVCDPALAADKLVGAWAQQGIIVPPHTGAPVFEFRADGTVIYDAGAGQSHRGTYRTSGKRLFFGGWADTVMTYQITHDVLSITARSSLPGAVGPGVVTQWRRLPFMSLIAMKRVNGQSVPTGLGGMIKRELVYASTWKKDAYPYAMTVQKYGPGLYSVETDFVSPSTARLFIIRVSPHFIDTDTAALNGDPDPAIPVKFVDLPEAVTKAHGDGLKGTFTMADLRSYDKHGAVWTVSNDHNGVTLAAATGADIKGDVTGYIARYNKQWARARANLRRLFASKSGGLPSVMEACKTSMNTPACRAAIQRGYAAHAADCDAHPSDSVSDSSYRKYNGCE